MQKRQSFLLFRGNHLPWFLTIVSFTKQLAQLLKPAKGAIRCDDLEPTGKGRTQMMGNQTQMLGNLLNYIRMYMINIDKLYNILYIYIYSQYSINV